jgi:hypothetical protein
LFAGASSLSLLEVQSLRTRLWAALTQLPGRAVIWADLRPTNRFSPEVADKVVEMLRVDNPKVERSAYPVPWTGVDGLMGRHAADAILLGHR